MATQSNLNLFNALAAALPLSFLKGLASAGPNLFEEAFNEVSHSTVIDPSQVPVLVPHVRRAMFETQFKRQAIDAGLKAYVRPTKKGGGNFTVVEAGKFVFTASFVPTRGHAVRSADFRTEHSALNELLDQGVLFENEEEVPNLPNEVIANSEAIYGILLYGGDLSGKSNFFMEFAIPEVNGTGYVDHYSFFDVLMAAQEFAAPASDLRIQGPIPTFKPHAVPKVEKKDGTTDTDNP